MSKMLEADGGSLSIGTQMHHLGGRRYQDQVSPENSSGASDCNWFTEFQEEGMKERSSLACHLGKKKENKGHL